MLSKSIRFLYYSLFLLTPVLVFSGTSELFEFNKMHFIYLVALAVGALWTLDMIRRRKLLIVNTPYDVGLGVFILAHVVSFFFSIDKHVSLVGYYGRLNGGIISLIAYIVLAYAFAVYMKKEHVLRLLKLSVAAAVMVVLIGLPGWFGHDTLCYLFARIPTNTCWTAQFKPAERMFSTIGQPNWLAAYVGANLFIALGLYANSVLEPYKQAGKMRKQILYAATIALLSGGILMTRSRSGMIAVGVGVVFMLISQWLATNRSRWISAKKPGMLLAAALISMVFIAKTGMGPVDRVLSGQIKPQASTVQTQTNATRPAQAPEVTDSFTIRTIVWTGAAELIKKYPFTGTGVETFAYAYPMVRPKAHNLTTEWDFIYNKAHNEYLNYAATLGIVGLVGYLWYQGAIGWIGWKAWKEQSDSTRALPAKKAEHHRNIPEIGPALIAGLTLSLLVVSITNAVGFSTSTVQLMMFLWPMGLLVLTDRVEGFAIDKAPTTTFKQNMIGYAGIGAVVILSGMGLIGSYTGDLYYTQGNAYLDTGEAQKAIGAYSRAVDANPTEHVYQDKLGQALAQVALMASLTPENKTSADELVRLSEKYEQNAIDASPKNNSYWRNYGKNELLIYQIKGSISPLEKSLNAFNQAALLAPTDPRPVYSQCIVYSLLAGEQPNKKLELQEKSLDCADETIALKPDYFDAYVLKGQLYNSYDMTTEAQEWLAKTKKQFPYISPSDIESEMGINSERN